MKIIKEPTHIDELKEIAKGKFSDMIKVVVDIEQEIIAVGGGLHADEEILLMEDESSERENTWGINIFFDKSGDEFIEFDSMINLKPAFGNKSRGVEDPEIREKIKSIIARLVIK